MGAIAPPHACLRASCPVSCVGSIVIAILKRVRLACRWVYTGETDGTLTLRKINVTRTYFTGNPGQRLSASHCAPRPAAT